MASPSSQPETDRVGRTARTLGAWPHYPQYSHYPHYPQYPHYRRRISDSVQQRHTAGVQRISSTGSLQRASTPLATEPRITLPSDE